MRFFSKSRSTFIALALSVLFFVPATVRGAGEDCCLVISSERQYGLNIVERVRNIGTDNNSAQENSCRVSAACNTQPVRTCWSIRGTGIVSDRTATQVFDDPECDDNSSRVLQVTYERAVSCTSNTLCANALKDSDNCGMLSEVSCLSPIQANNCFFFSNKCLSRSDTSVCPQLPQNLCGQTTNGSVAGSVVCRWLQSAEGGRCVSATESAAASRFANTRSDILPDCAIQGTCRSIKDLENLAFKIVDVLFTIMGTVAFAFFIYGGVVMIVSFGNGDQFSKGKNILIAAVVGIIISFSAYLLVGYIYTLLGIPNTFRQGIEVGNN